MQELTTAIIKSFLKYKNKQNNQTKYLKPTNQIHWIPAAFEGRLHNIMRNSYGGFVLVVTYMHMMKSITEKCKTDLDIANPALSPTLRNRPCMYQHHHVYKAICHMHTLNAITATSVTQICILERYTV